MLAIQVKLEILEPGDDVLNATENTIAVKKPSGEVEIFQYYVDEDNNPRLEKCSYLVTYGKGNVDIVSSGNVAEV
ncbi:MAG: hypothetical protein BEN18_03595 [Epulopiscium sp. Nuni2H_MBin001]|nr:MAG: hypothetical protein BEN18_03595 [Epulopiscium sp. Nuni2H_MBin001]